MTDKITHLYHFIERSAERWPDKITFRRRSAKGDYQGRSFKEMKAIIDEIACGLSGEHAPGDRIALLCDSSWNWFLVDCAILACGCVSVPRGTDVTDDDILYILNHSESKTAIVMRQKDCNRLDGLKNKLPFLKNIYTLELDNGELARGNRTIEELRQAGQRKLAENPSRISELQGQIDPGALATLIYTSGTTGEPKGVMLAQTGWIQAVLRTMKRLGFTEQDRGITLLPPWHAFERALEYGVICKGMDCLFTDPANIREDLFRFKPTVFPSVPRIWESVYNGIISRIKKEPSGKQKIFNTALKAGSAWSRYKSILFDYNPEVQRPPALLKVLRRLWSGIALLLMLPARAFSYLIFKKIHQALGGVLRFSITGGSALPGAVDHFLSAIGITVQEGYGMTETSAVISIRDGKKPTSGAVGKPLEGYRIKLKNEAGVDIKEKPGEKGTLWVKHDQILMGYYKRPELNSTVFDADGFFDTGDLMLISHRGELLFAGRAKDTIALAGGENVEPVPIEDRLLSSQYIDQVMVVGDDKKTLGALLVPHFDLIEARLKADFEDVQIPEKSKWNESPEIRALLRKEISELVNQASGFKSFETIPANCFYIVPRNFDPDQEMTRTLKMKRPVIKERFQVEIDGMYR